MITLIIKKIQLFVLPSGAVHFLCPASQLDSGCETRTKAPKSPRTSLLLHQVTQPATGTMKCHKKCKVTGLPLPAWCRQPCASSDEASVLGWSTGRNRVKQKNEQMIKSPKAWVCSPQSATGPQSMKNLDYKLGQQLGTVLNPKAWKMTNTRSTFKNFPED